MKYLQKFLKPLIICAVSLICMATSCPKYHDPFEKETEEGVGNLGFYLDGQPVSYKKNRIAGAGMFCKDSIWILAYLDYEDYYSLIMQFPIEDISVENPIKNPDIRLRYVYKVIEEKNEYGNLVIRTLYKDIKAETGELSFRFVGPSEDHDHTSCTTLSGNFFFEGNDYLDSGDIRKVTVTGGTFDVCYQHYQTSSPL